MVRLVVIDRRPAVRCGVEALLRSQPGVAPVGAAADRGELWPLLYRTDPDVVLVGEPRADDAIGLCLRIRARFPGKRMVVYADGDDALVPAAFAGVHGIVARTADVRELLEHVRAAGGGEPSLPPITPLLQRRAADRLDPRDRAILAMRLAGTAPHDIGATVGLSPAELDGRNAAIVAALRGLGRAGDAGPPEAQPVFFAA